MHAVVLTFPGHFFQTQLCLRNIRKHYPEIADRITVIADDVQCSPWHDYISDLEADLACDPSIKVIAASTLDKIKDCVAGWWRQQLIKLTLDQIFADDQWFVVDGDVIFHGRCDVRDRVPISTRHDPTARWSQMCVNYVQGVLGIDQGTLCDGQRTVITSAIKIPR